MKYDIHNMEMEDNELTKQVISQFDLLKQNNLQNQAYALLKDEQYYYLNLQMDSQSKVAHTFCKKCCNYVRTKNFPVHQQRCSGSSYLKQRQAYRQIQSKRDSRFNKKQSSSTLPEQQTIPCHYCGYPQTFAQLDTHPKRCQHRQQECRRCKEKFPRPLMDQHYLMCSVPQPRPIIQPQQRPREPYEYRPISPLVFGAHRRNPFQMMSFMGNPHPMAPIHDRSQALFLLDNLSHLIEMLARSEMSSDDQGLSSQQIKTFKTNKYSERQKQNAKIQEQQEMCVICYCNFKEEDNCLTLNCQHIFHPQCIGTWLSKNPTCPVCKKNYSKKLKEEENLQEDRDFQPFRIPFRGYRF